MTHEKQERIQGQGGATPGPWQVYDSHPQAACLYIDSAGKGHSFGDIATVYSEPLPAGENAANAKLIAAAPDHALLLWAAETAEQMADLAASAVRELAASNRERDVLRRERDMAYSRTDEMANTQQTLIIESNAKSERIAELEMLLRLAQHETATQPPGAA